MDLTPPVLLGLPANRLARRVLHLEPIRRARGSADKGFPTVIRVDQGSEFVSRDLDLWAYQRGVTPRNTILSLHEHNLYPWPARSELGNH